MTSRTLTTLAALGSLALLLGAFAFQYIGGLAPCHLCLWQRWPHAAAIVAGVLALAMPAVRFWRFLGLLAALTASGLGVFHTGVERGWWQGPTTCTGGGDLSGLSTGQLLDQILSSPIVRCDAVAWQFAGLSMASWNAILSFLLALFWAAALLKRD
ncbi:disulfide bond formation protein B [Haematobacter massiliensis]|uniref:Dihydroneopterin aldolase n=1 Tax=Haematobacter massiliensis TaxID=195105 RepID=A0A086YBZ9_9RHOB|nr:disulfide bond formation protein B [Haematobacter massiliensis]KFI31799.1 dihydroneopterin aldolase [Haematobacter massiliensis]OWJ72185.1 disulfide bond formation protein B [Haematobacter massiliensis]OWJ87755.1 disulfide bond formation protein B [Haematobacter massiliensis]QBJ24192.1 disulfide bond formation protein B [Haematobacter massiliensis]